MWKFLVAIVILVIIFLLIGIILWYAWQWNDVGVKSIVMPDETVVVSGFENVPTNDMVKLVHRYQHLVGKQVVCGYAPDVVNTITSVRQWMGGCGASLWHDVSVYAIRKKKQATMYSTRIESSENIRSRLQKGRAPIHLDNDDVRGNPIYICDRCWINAEIQLVSLAPHIDQHLVCLPIALTDIITTYLDLYPLVLPSHHSSSEYNKPWRRLHNWFSPLDPFVPTVHPLDTLL